ncbi:MAG: hypothetical protein A2144_12715 [Chloroflexi bacterium RBG_16_50_9]|nr:MAG: hypothetical protein A2144_12715 [Chloroflexi bacterium RBG_16_50_9]
MIYRYLVFFVAVEGEAAASFNFFISLDLRRAALLLWITFFSAALSREMVAFTTASRAASSSPEKISFSAPVTLVLT